MSRQLERKPVHCYLGTVDLNNVIWVFGDKISTNYVTSLNAGLKVCCFEDDVRSEVGLKLVQ